MLLSVVLPTYREADNLRWLLPALRGHLADVEHEIIVVDDDSRDGTQAIVAAHDARCITRLGERGLGTAVVRGLREARGTYVLVMDADGQHPLDAVPRLLNRAIETDAGLVVGTRIESKSAFGAVRRAISHGAAALSRALLPPVRRARLTDPMTGLFLVRRDRVDVAALHPTGYKVLLEILARCDVGRVEEVDYAFGPRAGGHSKMGPAVMWQFLVHLLGLAWTHPENRRIGRFAMVGATGVAVNLSLLYLLTDLAGLHYLLSAVISIEASIVSNFLLNDHFTFRDRREGHRMLRMARFNAVSLAALAINLGVLFILTSGLGLHYLASEAIAIVAAFALNYAGNLHWTYGSGDRVTAAWRQIGPWLPLAAVVLGFATLASHDLDRPDEIYFDEHYYISVAYQYNAGIIEDPCWVDDGLAHRPLNFEHPPLAKLIIAWSVAGADDVEVFPGCREPDSDAYAAFTQAVRGSGSQVAWRAPSVVFGTVTVLFAGLAAARLFSSPAAGALAAFFVATDGVIFTSSRLAILDIFAAAAVIVAFWAATHPSRRGAWGAAFALALGFACKFTVVFAAPWIFAVVLWTQHRAGTLDRKRSLTTLGAFASLPVLVLLLSYAPWWRLWIAEHGFAWAVGHWFKIQGAALAWGASVESGHAYASPPWRWLLVERPVFYYAMWNAGGVQDVNRYVYGVGNPVMWWSATVAAVAALIAAAIRARRDRIQPGPLAMAAFVATMTMVAFMPLPREMFLFYMTLIVPLLAVALAGALATLWRHDLRVGALVTWTVAALVALAFYWYYPILSAQTISAERFQDIIGLVPWMRA